MKRYKGEGKIRKSKGYMKWLRKNRSEELKRYPFGKSRRVITEILIANDLYKEKADKTKYSEYKPRIKRYYPGAQIVIDGKEIKVIVNGSTYTYNLEMSKDMKSDAITSHVISDEETAEAVASTIQEHIQRHGKPLSVLIDNSTANLSEEVEVLLKDKGIIDIKAYPGNAESKGDIEGEFSKIEEKIGDIRINGKTESEIACSIVETIIKIYVEMRNQTPRCSVCDRVPLELMKYEPSENERRDTIESLNKQKEKSEAIRANKKLNIPEEKELLITGVIERNRLEVTDIDRFKKALSKYDSKAIKEAEDDFYAYSMRETFEETKRTGQYFLGIVKNKQIEIDQERKKELLKNRYLLRPTKNDSTIPKLTDSNKISKGRHKELNSI
ncbi:MAG: transposase family protein [Candidatus Brocadiaceae bacterium]|nr:transposase family protein [Candidatus Brocadiaceae bacterium]